MGLRIRGIRVNHIVAITAEGSNEDYLAYPTFSREVRNKLLRKNIGYGNGNTPERAISGMKLAEELKGQTGSVTMEERKKYNI